MKKLIIIIILLIRCFAIHAQGLDTGISVHDPVIIKQDSVYHIFCTGTGITQWSSVDKIHWKKELPVFAVPPQWTLDAVPGFNGFIWAPDISYHRGLYYLYYAVSTFGKNTSVIGVATNTTLNLLDPGYKWQDHGEVIRSAPGKTNWNAIDPNLVTDSDGTPYLVFGSFWDGIKLVRLTADRLSVAGTIDQLPTIASRKKDPTTDHPAGEYDHANPIEAPFIYRHGKYFYLFASIDYCCRGPQSTYKIIVGRSKSLVGPYLDKVGLAMSKGGGTILLQGDEHWYGLGHNGVANFDGQDYMIYHAYDATDRGIPKLQLKKINWPGDWPVVSL